MAKAKLPENLERKLDDYKAAALTQVIKLDKVTAEYLILMQKRRGLAQMKQLTDEKRAEWNKKAAEWRTTKKRVLAEATAAHTPQYNRIRQEVGELHGPVQYVFTRVLHTLNNYYVKADSRLRARTLEDL